MKKFSLSDKLQAIEKMRRDFIANVSHELRTPLTVIHGYLETLIEQADDKTKQNIFELMYQQTTRMENIINDLLLLSSLESEEKTIQHKKINLAKLLKSICNEAKILSGKNNHVFHLSIDPKIIIQGDEKELCSMISNLIFNAVKYTPANEHIFIDWYQDLNYAYLKIRDTGIGIAKKHIPRITERFYRVDKARSRASGGTGLGLAIVKHVLNRHNAQLEIQSELGKGSTFICVFPLTQR
ncbi:MAG: phosphate regulon sensor histidine kinase PhoR [Gammaproteobacteria bacterium]|jgi:two-component system phosphate regulon sensor histidine kinase PhoR